jgi:hypothetical protein
MSAIKLKNILNQILIENSEEKEYLVTYYIAKGDDDIDYDKKVKATSEKEAIAKIKKDAPRLARAFSAELVKSKNSLKEGGNLGHNEISSISQEGPYWIVTYRGSKGTTEKSFPSEEEARKFQDGLDEDVRFNFQKGGGGGKRFIPTNGIVPSKLFTALPNHFKMLGDQLLISPEAVIALTSVERGRGGAINYKELYGKLRGYFDIARKASTDFGPAQTSSFLSQFKQGLKGRLESVVMSGKEFKVWNGEGSKDEKGDFIFPLAQFKAMEENYFSNYGEDESTAEEDETEADVTYKRGADHFLNGAVEKAEQFRQQAIYQGQLTSQDEDEFPDYKSLFGGEDTEELQENEESLRSQLHTLVGNEMRLGKRVGMTGASNHAEEHKKAEKAVEDFLRMNPSMEDYRDEVEDHFTKLLFK